MQNLTVKECECPYCKIGILKFRRKLKKGRVFSCNQHGIFVTLTPCRKFGGRMCPGCEKWYCDICYDLDCTYCKECRIPEKFVFGS